MAARTIGLHVFCSAKGGVGKSTLAVAAAKLLAAQGRVPVLIDADLTGTSLADGLALCAPEVTIGPDGHPDLTAQPTGRSLTRRETLRLLDGRNNLSWDNTEPSPPPPFFNDVLRGAAPDRECQIDALFWRHRDDDKVLYLPSSPARRDVLVALGWLYKEEPFTWLQRVTWILDEMAKQVPTLSDVVFDLPPGLFGFAHEMLALVSNLEKGTTLPSGFPKWPTDELSWRGNALLVTTPDRNDLFAAIDYSVRQKEDLTRLGLVLNKSTEATMSRIRADIRERRGEAHALIELAQVGEMRATLGEVFTSGALPLTDEVHKLRAALRIEE
jgi:hypothetical protein